MKKKRVTEVAEEGKLWAVGLAGGERGVIDLSFPSEVTDYVFWGYFKFFEKCTRRKFLGRTTEFLLFKT